MNARDLSEPPKTGRPRDAPLRRTLTITEGKCTRNKGTALKGSPNARLLIGVAQITRNRSRNLLLKPLFLLTILTWFQMSLEWPRPHRGREFSPSEARSRRRIEREMTESHGVFRALEQECHTFPRPRITIETRRREFLGPFREMQEVLIFRALNESAQDCVRTCRARATRGRCIAAVTTRRNCARRLIAQPRTIATRMESAWRARIQEMPGFKGFL